ncbi:MAG: hypothetical protein NC320_12155 [Clostridium sp.]|nr:hypothetical protein [Clostridium sp.]
MADQLSDFYKLAADHDTDTAENKIARIRRDGNQFGYRLYFFCYERENETFDLGFKIDSNDAEILNKIKEKEYSVSDYTLTEYRCKK